METTTESVLMELPGGATERLRGGKFACYVPPTTVVTVFALEEGFATTTQLQGESKTPANNQQTPAGQFGEQDWSRNTWN